jgi:hypothetical protein
MDLYGEKHLQVATIIICEPMKIRVITPTPPKWKQASKNANLAYSHGVQASYQIKGCSGAIRALLQ